MTTRHTALMVAAILLAVSTAQAAIINVPGDEPTIQAGIDAAMNGDEVVVAQGEYFENINFNGKAITLRSSDPLDPMIVANTIINGGGSGAVVECRSGEGADTVLSGFVITGGDWSEGGGMYNFNSSPTVTNCTFSGNTAQFFGGGMNNSSGSPTVTDCTFSGNSAAFRGGGMYNIFSNPTVTDCTFSGNSASSGGGMFNDGVGLPTVTNCTFNGNSADNGGGMYNLSGSPTVINCTFTKNSAAVIGGGMLNNSSSPTVTNCTFSGNTADFGGGMLNAADSNPTVINCTFTGNQAAVDGGGGMDNDCSSPTVINCTFSGNLAGAGGGIVNVGESSAPTVTNCIVWGNTAGQIFDTDGAVSTVSFTDVQGGWLGLGSNNIDADPLFVDAPGGDLRLQASSPCIDAGDNTAVPVEITTDLDGNPRFVDDLGTIDTGNGDPPVVDMGAYEFQGTSCPWDCDGGESTDGTVGITDFLLLLAQWGQPGSCDFDGGDVGINDFLALLANWGPCP